MKQLHTLNEIAAYLRAHPESFHETVHADIFVRILDSRMAFSRRKEDIHREFVPALAWVFERAEDDGSLNPDLRQQLSSMGRDHRRHGMPSEAYQDFQHSIEVGLAALALSDAARTAALKCTATMCQTMAEAAAEADLQGIPPAQTAQVVDIAKPNRHHTIVRLELGLPVDYFPGQHIPVTTPLMPGSWCYLTPATPSDVTGQLEFHLANVGEISNQLSASRPGDLWTLGTPRGEFVNFPGYKVVFVVYGNGWAAVRPYLVSLAEAAHAAGSSQWFEATVFAIASSPGEHYDLDFQRNLTAMCPWITIHHFVRETVDPPLLGAANPPADIPMTVAEDPASEAIAQLRLFQHSFVLVGPADEVLAGRKKLIDAGVDPKWIESHPWESGQYWPSPED